MSQDKGTLVTLLPKFTRILNEENPMRIEVTNDLEYEPEALSILSRFNEAGLRLASPDDDVTGAARVLVAESLKFWFDISDDLDVVELTDKLLVQFLEVK